MASGSNIIYVFGIFKAMLELGIVMAAISAGKIAEEYCFIVALIKCILFF